MYLTTPDAAAAADAAGAAVQHDVVLSLVVAIVCSSASHLTNTHKQP